VDHPTAVRIVQRVRHFAGDPHRLVHAELGLAIELVPQRLPFNEGHDVIQEPVRRPGIKKRQDVRMLQRSGGSDLDDKPVCA